MGANPYRLARLISCDTTYLCPQTGAEIRPGCVAVDARRAPWFYFCEPCGRVHLVDAPRKPATSMATIADWSRL